MLSLVKVDGQEGVTAILDQYLEAHRASNMQAGVEITVERLGNEDVGVHCGSGSTANLR